MGWFARTRLSRWLTRAFIATYKVDLSEATGELSDYPTLESLFTRSLNIRRELLGPHHRRVAAGHNNLGLLYQFQQNFPKTEYSLRTALALEPRSLEYQYALAEHLLKLRRFEDARPIVEEMISTHPENPAGRQMLDFIKRNTGQ